MSILELIGRGAVSAVVVGTVTAPVFNDVTSPYIGVPINVIVAACAGAIAAFAFTKGEESRGKLFSVAFACVILACAITSVFNSAADFFWDWELKPNHVSSMAVIIAFFSRWLLPALIERIGPFLDKIPFFGNTKSSVTVTADVKKKSVTIDTESEGE